MPLNSSPGGGEGKGNEKELSAVTDSEQYPSSRATAAFTAGIVIFFGKKLRGHVCLVVRDT